MTFRLTFALISILLGTNCVAENDDRTSKEEQHIRVSMRMIGHQLLLSLGDSVSRVLPIEQEGDRYKIPFETEFQFNPEELVATIAEIARETRISEHYIVEMVECQTNNVVYSYEIGNEDVADLIACHTREQTKSCYDLYFTILDRETPPAEAENVGISRTQPLGSDPGISPWLLGLAVLIGIGGVAVYSIKRKNRSAFDPDTATIGAFRFNNRKMELSYEGKTIELTSKESALLQLLYDSANDTVERDTILRMVWNDEGDYVGRTLDVFISKLRKKLQADSRVKIANIRGVGYKLIVST